MRYMLPLPPVRPRRAIDERIVIALGVLLSLLFASRVLYPIMNGTDHYLTLPEDDFYYYYIVAKNLIGRGMPTFDGVTLTNGFHPLWLLVLTALQWLSGQNDVTFFVLLGVAELASALTTLWLLLKIVRQMEHLSAITYAGMLLSFLFALRMIGTGMECCLCVPAFAYYVLYLKKFSDRSVIQLCDWTIFGAVSSLLVLARLDSQLMVAMSFLYLIYVQRIHLTNPVRVVAAFLLGLSPVIAYYVFNEVTMGHLFSVSSQAKSLKSDLVPSVHAISPFIAGIDGKLILGMLAIGSLPGLGRNVSSPPSRWGAIMRLTCAFSLLSVFLFTILSDWMMFSWYWYFLPVPLLFVSYRIDQWFSRFGSHGLVRLLIRSTCALIVLGLSLKALISVARSTVAWTEDPNYIYRHATVIARFASTHPGIYAMGDRAGLTAYLARMPFIQMEGLCSDFRMIDHLRRGDDLVSVLREYKVDYYVTTLVGKDIPAGRLPYRLHEPHVEQSGARSRKLIGAFPSSPVLVYEAPENSSPDAALRGGQPRAVTYVFRIPH